MFLNQVEELEEDEVDEIVEMGLGDSLRSCWRKILRGVFRSSGWRGQGGSRGVGGGERVLIKNEWARMF